MKDVKGIGFTIPSNDDLDYINLDSFSSLADTEIAIFAPDFDHTSYSTYVNSVGKNGQYEGKILYNKESSAKINEHCRHWKKELTHF